MILTDVLRGFALIAAFCLAMCGFPFLVIGFTFVCIADWIDRSLKW